MKKIIKYIWYAALALLFAVVLIRIFLFGTEGVFSEITPTDNAKAAFDAGGEIMTCDIVQDVSEDGFTRAYSFVALPESGEIQLTVKYNKGLLEKNNLSSPDEISFKLYNTVTGAEFYSVYREDFEKGLYGYARLVFENTEFSDGDGIEIVTFSADGTKNYSCFIVRYPGVEYTPYKLSESEKTALGG